MTFRTQSLVQHKNCALFLSGKMTSFLWLGDCGLRRLSIQHVSTVSWVTKRCIKACQGTIFKVVLRQSVRNAWKNVQISGHAVLWLRFEACISSEREMGLLLAGTGTARWRAGVDGRLGTGGDRVHRQEACYRFCCLPTQCVCVYVCVCGSQNKQPLFPYTTLTDWFV